MSSCKATNAKECAAHLRAAAKELRLALSKKVDREDRNLSIENAHTNLSRARDAAGYAQAMLNAWSDARERRQ